MASTRRATAEATAEASGETISGGGGGREQEENGGVTASWDYVDRLRQLHVTHDTPSSDVYRVPTTPSSSSDEYYYDLRHITHMTALLVRGAPSQVSVDGAAVSLMALHHFNHGIADVVPEIGTVRERCRTRFTMDFIDTKYSPIETSGAFLRDVLTRSERWEERRASRNDDEGGGTTRRRTGGELDSASAPVGAGSGSGRRKRGRKRRRDEEGSADARRRTTESSSHLRPDPQPVPTVMLGAIRSAVSSPLATLAGVYGVPQISYASTAMSFDNRDQFPYFGRVIPSAAGDADAAVDYLTGFLKVTHLGVLYIRDSYGTTYAQAILNAAGKAQGGTHPLKVRTASFPAGVRSEEELLPSVSEAIRQLKGTGLRYFFGVFTHDVYDLVMSEARRQGIAGGGYYWMFGDALMDVSTKIYDPATHSDVIEATRGAALVATASPAILEGVASYDAFVRHWDEMRNGRGPGRVYFEGKMPADFEELDGGEALTKHEFTAVPVSMSLMRYDAVISAIFATCDAEEKWRRENGKVATSTRRGSGLVGDADATTVEHELARIDGEDFFEAFLNHTFDGVYGTIDIDSFGSRRPTTIPYSVSNFLADPPNNNGKIAVTLTPTDVFETSSLDADGGSRWRNMESFVFSDGTTEPPPELPPLEHDPHVIDTGSRVAASVMCATVLFTSLFFLRWTHKHRRRRVIRSAQPVFLYVLAGGAFLMGLAIVPLGIEEPQAPSQLALDVACMAGPWLVAFGFSLTFSALHAKTLRINMIMKGGRDMRRVKVDAGQVMRPAAALVCLNAVIMTAWTVVAPLRFVRTPADSVDEYGRATSSVGMCSLPLDPNDPDKSWFAGILFVVIIAVVNGCMLAAALYQGQRAKHIETEYSESKYVKLSVMSIVQSWLIGIPLLFTGKDSPAGMYVVTSTILFMMCESILLLIFIPKMWFLREWKKKLKFRELERQRKAQTPTWRVEQDADKQSSWKLRGVRKLNYFVPEKFTESVRNLMQKIPSDQDASVLRGSSVAKSGEAEKAAEMRTVPSPGPLPEKGALFAANDSSHRPSERLDPSRVTDYSMPRHVHVSSASIGDSSHLEEGGMKISIREMRVMKQVDEEPRAIKT